MAKTPTPELVMLTWMRSLSAGVEVAIDAPDPTSWKGDMFIEVTNLSGTADAYVPLIFAVFRITFLAKPGELRAQPPWNKVNVLAMDVWKSTYTDISYGTLPLPNPFNAVKLHGLEALNLPSRVDGDIRNLARYDMDVQLPYIEENDNG